MWKRRTRPSGRILQQQIVAHVQEAVEQNKEDLEYLKDVESAP